MHLIRIFILTQYKLFLFTVLLHKKELPWIWAALISLLLIISVSSMHISLWPCSAYGINQYQIIIHDSYYVLDSYIKSSIAFFIRLIRTINYYKIIKINKWLLVYYYNCYNAFFWLSIICCHKTCLAPSVTHFT